MSRESIRYRAGFSDWTVLCADGAGAASGAVTGVAGGWSADSLFGANIQFILGCESCLPGDAINY